VARGEALAVLAELLQASMSSMRIPLTFLWFLKFQTKTLVGWISGFA
jgi:hypothetical protein